MAAQVSQWFTWQTSSGQLSVTLPGGVSIASLYFPNVPTAITCYVAGLVFYVASTGQFQVIPVPSGVTSVTLNAASGNTIYVFATSAVLNP